MFVELNQVEILFSERAIIRGGILIFTKQDTLEFIEQCRKSGIGILGIDAFFITETSTQPSMEHSVDYSSDRADQDCYNYDRALKFVAEKDDHIFFEIVCE
jgi:hypothetical protein